MVEYSPDQHGGMKSDSANIPIAMAAANMFCIVNLNQLELIILSVLYYI
jgi:hypothetical protein